MHIKINLKIFIFIVIFCLTRQIEIYGILMLFAFFHELGHLFAGVFLGFKPQSLNLSPVGLSISFKVKAEDYNKKVKRGNTLALKKLIIALAGPMVNFLIVILFLLFNNLNFWSIPKETIIYTNILVGAFNLIPIYPLDGGRILKNILHIILGLQDSHTYVNSISNIAIIMLTILSSIVILYLKNMSMLMIILYLWYLVIEENKKYAQRKKIYEVIQENLGDVH